MEFIPANAWHEFKQASRTEQGTLDDNGNEVVLGPRMNEAVRDFANGYLRALDIGEENKATDERAKLLDLHWGRIEHDGAQLRGLGAAVTDIAETLAANVATLGGAWQGESYDAFATAIGKVQRTLAEYGTAATTTGDGLVNAMGQARTMYQSFVEDTVYKHLDFGDQSPPEQWHRIGEDGRYLPDELAGGCPTAHLNTFDCVKDNDEQRNMIMGQLVSQRRWDILMQDPCEQSLDRVSIMYSNLKKDCDAAVERIKGKIDNYYGAVRTTVDGVTKLYDAALGNVYNLAHAEVFSSLRVIGGGPSTSDATPVEPGPSSEAGPVGPGAEPVEPGAEPVVEPVEPVVGSGEAASDAAAEPDVASAPEPVAEPTPEPPADTKPAAPLPPYTVQIQDGDRTLAVTSPPGDGTVRVTVTEGTGTTKSYELDFATASGLPPVQEDEPQTPGEPVEKVSARTDGKCVIQDGDVTITAERPLFSPDSLNVTIQDGTAPPTRYTLDFDNLPSQEDTPITGATPEPQPAARTPGADGTTGSEPATTRSPEADGTTAEAAGFKPATPGFAGAGVTAETAVYEPALGEPPVADGAIAESAGSEPTAVKSPKADGDTAEAVGSEPVAGESLGVDAAVAEAAGSEPAAAQSPEADGATVEAPESEPAVGEVDGMAGGHPAEADDSTAPGEPALAPGDSEPAVEEVDGGPAVAAAGGSTAPEQPTGAPAANHATSAAAADGGHWLGEEAGSVSGVLVPDRPEVEAGLPEADDVPDNPNPPVIPASGEVGAGLPIMGTPGTSTSTTDTGRAGSGWSVHGDLFDTTEPVYSMHGVLGDEDRSAESEHGTR